MIKIGRLNENWNKVNTKEELVELLKRYQGILSSSMIDYLNSLIELEFSVVKEYISNIDRKALAELELYKRIAIYNIYNRVENLIKQKNNEFTIFGNNDGREGLYITVKLNDRRISLFEFDYKEIYSNGWNTTKIPKGYKTMKIGEISLFQTLESQELRKLEINQILDKLERLYSERNPYPSRPGVVGGPGSDWAYRRGEEIKKYEEMFTLLDRKKELSDTDKQEIEITNQVHEALLEEFSLTSESFEDSKLSTESKLERKRVKKMTNLTITDNIKYI